tara:strand:- start:3593 stop:4954 length:1362 start_codon:yes stop_codon:yes gene_type:complete
MSKVIVDEIQTDTSNGNVRIIPNGTGKLEVKGAGGDDAMLQLNCSAQSHGVKIKSPNHSAGQSYTMILPDNQIAADKVLKVKSITGSGNNAVGQLEFGDVAAGLSTDSGDNVLGGTNAGSLLPNPNAGGGSVIIGVDAGKVVSFGSVNSIFGYKAGFVLSSGGANQLFGKYAGYNLTSGDNNTFIGGDAGYKMNGSNNTCIGQFAGYGDGSGGSGPVSTSNYDVFVGYRAGFSRSSGNSSVGVGWASLYTLTSGLYNTGCGAYTNYALTTGQYNESFGYAAGYDITTGDNNVCIGSSAGASSSPSGSITTGSNNVVLGNNSISNLYCADTSISSSDQRDKTDVTDFTKGLDWIEALRPVTYRWDRRTWYGTDEEPYGIPDGSKKRQRLHIGFLAQEALAVEQANGYGTNNDDSLILNLTDDGMSYGMKYERLVPILVNAIKELSARVKTLEGG